MISYLQGDVLQKEKNFVVLNVNGVGYKVFLPERTLNKITENEKSLKLFTHLYLKEDSAQLYGFLNAEELDFFETLNKIPGIGPKAALSIISTGSPDQFKRAVEGQDVKFFEGAKGIGKKKIQKIILELSGKFQKIESGKEPLADESLDALVSLGFPRRKAKDTLDKIPKEIKNSQQKIKEALKILGRGS